MRIKPESNWNEIIAVALIPCVFIAWIGAVVLLGYVAGLLLDLIFWVIYEYVPEFFLSISGAPFIPLRGDHDGHL